MQLRRLQLTQFRVFDRAEFDFQPGMNLVVGINGVGKSTLLDALRYSLSQVLPYFTAAPSRSSLSFGPDDITIDQDALTIELDFEAADIPFNYTVHEPREAFLAREGKEGEVRDQVITLTAHKRLSPEERSLPNSLRTRPEQPLAVYFSAHRSLIDRKASGKQSSLPGQAAAFADALIPRELRVREFAEWWLVQDALRREPHNPLPARRLAVLESVVVRFLDAFTGLRAVRGPRNIPTLILDKDGMHLDVQQLSDGERGVLALVLELARRLSQANPNLDDPLTNGQAVVLIDELDLHLHPRWQRDISRKLTETFPACQFVATTHSPQIVGEVPPENITIIERGRPPFPPDQSLGMDTNWILRYLMDAAERSPETEQGLTRIADLIESEQYDEATLAIETLRDSIGEFPELVRLQTRINRIRLLGE